MIRKLVVANSQIKQLSGIPYWKDIFYQYDELLTRGVLKTLMNRKYKKVLFDESKADVMEDNGNLIVGLLGVSDIMEFEPIFIKIVTILMMDLYNRPYSSTSDIKNIATCIYNGIIPVGSIDIDHDYGRTIYATDLLSQIKCGLSIHNNSCYIDSVLMVLLFGVYTDFKLDLTRNSHDSNSQIVNSIAGIYRNIIVPDPKEKFNTIVCTLLRKQLPGNIRVGPNSAVLFYDTLQDNFPSLRDVKNKKKSNLIDIYRFVTEYTPDIDSYEKSANLLTLANYGRIVHEPWRLQSRKSTITMDYKSQDAQEIVVELNDPMIKVLKPIMELEDGTKWEFIGCVINKNNAHYVGYIMNIVDGEKVYYYYDDLNPCEIEKVDVEFFEMIVAVGENIPDLIFYRKVLN